MISARTSSRIAAGMVTLAAMILAMGCAWTVKQTPASPIPGVPLETLKRNEYVIMNTVKGHGERTYLFGVITWGDSQYGTVGNPFFIERNYAEAAATYQALMQAKDADTFMPLTAEVSGHGFPYIYWMETADVTGKALRIKSDKESGK